MRTPVQVQDKDKEEEEQKDEEGTKKKNLLRVEYQFKA